MQSTKHNSSLILLYPYWSNFQVWLTIASLSFHLTRSNIHEIHSSLLRTMRCDFHMNKLNNVITAQSFNRVNYSCMQLFREETKNPLEQQGWGKTNCITVQVRWQIWLLCFIKKILSLISICIWIIISCNERIMILYISS